MNEVLKNRLADFGITNEEILNKISELGVETLEDLAELTAEDLRNCGVKLVTARKIVKALKPEATPEPKPVPATNVMTLDGILPTVPSDEAWLSALKSGGVIKVDDATYIAAIRAALADKTDMYNIPKRLVEEMEKFANENEDPVDAEFYKLMKQLTRRSYAEIFAAIDGVDGSFVSEKRKAELIKKINANLWPALGNAYNQLVAWREAWIKGIGPEFMMYAMSGQQLPPGMGAVPDAGALRDAADDVRNAINRSLSGVGPVIASAMSYDFCQIKKTLEDSSLPAKIGAANRDQMFKKLGLNVESSMIRNESNIVRFVLSFVHADETLSGEAESRYFGSLFMLGSQINWAQLGIMTTDDKAGVFVRLDGTHGTRL